MVTIKILNKKWDGIQYEIYNKGKLYGSGISPSLNFLIDRTSKDFRINKNNIQVNTNPNGGI